MANKKRLIDAKPVVQFIVDGLNNPNLKKAFGHDAIEILTEIEYSPTVDAVEVVRCKDCKSWKCLREDRGLCKHPTFTLEDDTIDPLTEPDDFCSYGERREGE